MSTYVKYMNAYICLYFVHNLGLEHKLFLFRIDFGFFFIINYKEKETIVLV